MIEDNINNGNNQESPINITVNITNNRHKNIPRSGYCYTFILEWPDGTNKECFCPFNNTMDIITPHSSFEQTINLLEFSYNQDTWERIGKLPIGCYTIYAVYKSETNPWSVSLPYNKTTSNSLTFEVVTNNTNGGNGNSDGPLFFTEKRSPLHPSLFPPLLSFFHVPL